MKKFIDGFFAVFVRLVFAWVVFAFGFEVYTIYVHFTDEEKEQQMANEFAWKFDGRFKDSPGNIWYNKPDSTSLIK